MKKIIVLVAALMLIVPVSAMAGMTAFMDMNEMTDTEMASTTGQTGITINQTLNISGGYIAWGDDDGCANSEGWLTLSTLTVSQLVITGMTIDVCHASGTVTTWLTIGQPALTVSAGIAAIKVGSVINGGASLGELVIHSLAVGAMTIQITGH